MVDRSVTRRPRCSREVSSPGDSIAAALGRTISSHVRSLDERPAVGSDGCSTQHPAQRDATTRMELAFIISAIRRYFWFVIVVALAGALPGLLSGGGGNVYRSRGVLLISPPADSAFSFSSDPDRFVISQLSVLRSDIIADRVAALVEREATAAFVSSVVTFDHEPETDIVEVFVETGDPELSQTIGAAYLDTYVALLRDQAAGALEPIDEELVEVRRQIEENDQRLAAAMAPYLVFQPTAAGDAYPPIPSPNQVVPSVVSEREILIAKYNELLSTRTRIDTNNLSNSAGRIIQTATLPTQPVPESATLLLAAGVVVGAFVGMLGAVLIARLSPRVLDDLQAEEILGQSLVGAVPWERSFASDRRTALKDPPVAVARMVDSLCVRAEAIAESRESLTVVVVGTQRAAGTTTLSCALASRFAANGSSVLLVDGDQRDPMLRTMFEANDQKPRKLSADLKGLHRLNGVAVPNLEIASFTDGTEVGTMRSQQVAEVMEEAKARADVVVIDGGPLMSASSTVQLTRLCDAVVLTMPRHQEVRPLVQIARELDRRSFLPVWTPAGRPGRRLPRRTSRRTRRLILGHRPGPHQGRRPGQAQAPGQAPAPGQLPAPAPAARASKPPRQPARPRR